MIVSWYDNDRNRGSNSRNGKILVFSSILIIHSLHLTPLVKWNSQKIVGGKIIPNVSLHSAIFLHPLLYNYPKAYGTLKWYVWVWAVCLCNYLLFLHISLSNAFWRLLLISNWNFHDVCQRFLYNQKRNFSWIRQKVRNFPIDPHYKNRPLLYRHDVTKVGDF